MDQQEQWEAVHTQLCDCVFHNATGLKPASGFGSNPEPPFPLTDPTVQGGELLRCRRQEITFFWKDLKAFVETRFFLKDAQG